MAKKEDKREILKIAVNYIRLLKEHDVKVKKAYLYGSYVRGNFYSDSDIDVAVILDMDKGDMFEEHLRLMKLRRKIDTRIEPHVFSLKDFEKKIPFIKEILRERIEIKV